METEQQRSFSFFRWIGSDLKKAEAKLALPLLSKI